MARTKKHVPETSQPAKKPPLRWVDESRDDQAIIEFYALDKHGGVPWDYRASYASAMKRIAMKKQKRTSQTSPVVTPPVQPIEERGSTIQIILDYEGSQVFRRISAGVSNLHLHYLAIEYLMEVFDSQVTQFTDSLLTCHGQEIPFRGNIAEFPIGHGAIVEIAFRPKENRTPDPKTPGELPTESPIESPTESVVRNNPVQTTESPTESPTEPPTDSSTERPTESPPTVYSEYNEPPGLYFLHDDGQGGVSKIYEDGHSSNDDNEPDFYLEDDGAGGFRRIYQDSYYTTDYGQRIYTDGHESNDDDPHALHYAVQTNNLPTRRVYKDGRESIDSD